MGEPDGGAGHRRVSVSSSAKRRDTVSVVGKRFGSLVVICFVCCGVKISDYSISDLCEEFHHAMELQIIDLDQFVQIISSVSPDSAQPLYFRLKPRSMDVFSTSSSKQLFSRANLYLTDSHLDQSDPQTMQSQTMTQTPAQTFLTQNGQATQSKPHVGSVFTERSCASPQLLFCVNSGVFLAKLYQLQTIKRRTEKLVLINPIVTLGLPAAQQDYMMLTMNIPQVTYSTGPATWKTSLTVNLINITEKPLIMSLQTRNQPLSIQIKSNYFRLLLENAVNSLTPHSVICLAISKSSSVLEHEQNLELTLESSTESGVTFRAQPPLASIQGANAWLDRILSMENATKFEFRLSFELIKQLTYLLNRVPEGVPMLLIVNQQGNLQFKVNSVTAHNMQIGSVFWTVCPEIENVPEESSRDDDIE